MFFIFSRKFNISFTIFNMLLLLLRKNVFYFFKKKACLFANLSINIKKEETNKIENIIKNEKIQLIAREKDIK